MANLGLKTTYPVCPGTIPQVAVHIVFPTQDNQTLVVANHRYVCDFLYAGYQYADGASTFQGLIKKPKGQVGCLSRGGYSLRSVLRDWSNDLYSDVQARLSPLGLFIAQLFSRNPFDINFKSTFGNSLSSEDYG